ncbi:MAG: hypothetical protein ACJZ3J_03715 [Candidatus Poseidoniales archaeon]|jgi:TATA-box binding protein (TBP) (component of TFIID and TFIIIB)|uniref:TATA-box-binding protein n=1 Tax=Marine Group III euryarchaeote CG-Epi1 TaxID=1888995 RepID=A0A1J5TII9_9ARCH|nr:MAG: hypothetical protein BD935_03260 [Marine Group III euryarchaeote CG-Epi1]|tara:strand:+ start:206 stop:784 length:579 start_codon:yes stop_codon:yes gene_type:complete
MISVANLEIENVIVASHLGKDIELIKLATELPNARYSSSGNPSVIIELDRTNPKFIGHKRLKAAGVLFSNGKVLVTGIASLQEGKEIIAKLKSSIRDIDPKISTKRATKIENMVTRLNFGKRLDLQLISNAIPGSEYDPLRFQGLIIRVDNPLASFILFESGVAVITDIVSEAKAKKAFKELKNLIESSILA